MLSFEKYLASRTSAVHRACHARWRAAKAKEFGASAQCTRRALRRKPTSLGAYTHAPNANVGYDDLRRVRVGELREGRNGFVHLRTCRRTLLYRSNARGWFLARAFSGSQQSSDGRSHGVRIATADSAPASKEER
jgi:hypothetical protein